jgi:C-terminal processing protease CtpA/Prc
MLLVVPLAALLALVGCSDGGNADLQQRVAELEKENAGLRTTVERLSGELRPLRAKVDKLDQDQQLMEKTLIKAKKDLEARVTDMVQQAVRGKRPRHVPPAAPQVRFEVRPYMGFDGQDIEEDVAQHLKLQAKTGVLVTDVREGSPAAVGGIKKNDVVQAFDEKEVKTFEDLKTILAKKKPGEIVTLIVVRGKEKVTVKVALGTRRVRVEG